jgi:hypothetical protein
MGGRIGRVLLVGCEPEPSADPDGFGAGLSVAVRTAVDEAIPLILSLAGRLLRGEDVGAGNVDVNPLLEDVTWRV